MFSVVEDTDKCAREFLSFSDFIFDSFVSHSRRTNVSNCLFLSLFLYLTPSQITKHTSIRQSYSEAKREPIRMSLCIVQLQMCNGPESVRNRLHWEKTGRERERGRENEKKISTTKSRNRHQVFFCLLWAWHINCMIRCRRGWTRRRWRPERETETEKNSSAAAAAVVILLLPLCVCSAVQCDHIDDCDDDNTRTMSNTYFVVFAFAFDFDISKLN